MFNNTSLNFSPNVNLATPLNYELGPGDELNISVFGVQEADFALTISPEGSIIIPNVGKLQLAGITIEDAADRIKSLMSKTAYSSLRNNASKLSVNVGNIKSISVTIIGSNLPGNYTLPSLATAFNALFSAGGPSKFGTFRQIELVRNNQPYKKIDLYRFLVNGDQSDNVTLRNNDVIRIPSYKTRIKISGYVKRPGIFELLPGEKLSDLLTFCSGFSDSSYKASVKVVQFTDRELSVKDVSSQDFNQYQPQDGDSIIVDKVLARYANRISITGAVFREGIFELTKQMSLNDLIRKADGLREDAFIERGQVFRLKNDLTKEVLSFTPTDSVGNSNFLLRREDSVVIKSIFDLRDSLYISVQGEIRSPGYYNYNDSLTLKDIILLAGGFTDAAYPQRIEIARIIRRDILTAQDVRASETIQVTGMEDLASEAKNVQLKPSDIVIVRRKPGFLPLQTITVSGQMQYPGPYALEQREERVSNIIKRAGGFTPEAYLEGAYLKRYNFDDKTNTIRKQTISKIQEQLNDSTNVIQEDFEKDFDQIPLNINKIISSPGSAEDVVLIPGDELFVPKFNAQVRINGSVLFPTQIPYNEKYGMRYYISSAGGISPDGKRSRIYVLYANGKAASTRRFLFFKTYPDVKPGTEIIVPAKPENRTRLSTGEFIAISSALASLAGVVIAILRL
ncbi:MAG: SLBB domain-containing protein, partial [Parafilimonas sp.]